MSELNGKKRRKRVALGVAGALVLAVLLLSRTEFEIRHTIDLEAPPERVWSTLVDFPGYAAWNTQLAYLGGSAAPGGELHLKLSAEGATPYEFKPAISRFDEPRVFAWIGRTGVPRLFDGEHFFELDRLPSGGTRLTNREEYRGVLSLIIRRLPMMKSAPAGFEKMDRELEQHLQRSR